MDAARSSRPSCAQGVEGATLARCTLLSEHYRQQKHSHFLFPADSLVRRGALVMNEHHSLFPRKPVLLDRSFCRFAERDKQNNISSSKPRLQIAARLISTEISAHNFVRYASERRAELVLDFDAHACRKANFGKDRWFQAKRGKADDA
eukprot:3085225-Pleurochrysis_carterae.AAC.1